MTALHLNRIFMLALSISGPPGVANTQSKVPNDPQVIAKMHMEAFQHGDFKTVAALTHPASLSIWRVEFFGELSKAKSANREKAYLEPFGVKQPINELAKLSTEELLALVLGNSYKKDLPAIREAKIHTKVEIISVQEQPKTIVRIRFITPTGETNITRNVDVELQLVGSEWKVFRWN